MAEFAPLDLSFTRQAVISSFETAPEALISLTEPFASNSGQFTEGTFGADAAATFTVSGGQGTFSYGSTASNSRYCLTGPDIDFAQFWIEAEIVSFTATGTVRHVGVGVSDGANFRLSASWDKHLGQVGLRVTISGSGTTHGYTAVTLTPPFKIGMALQGRVLSVWTNSGTGWVYRSSVNLFTARSFEPRTYTWTGVKPYFFQFSNTAVTAVFDNFRAGRFGAVGYRDFSPITDESGRAVSFAGKVRLLATGAGPLGAGTLKVLEFDPATNGTSEVGLIVVSRDSGVWDDIAAHAVKLASGNYKILLSTWGNGFGGDLHVRYLETASDLSTGVHVLSGTTSLKTLLPNVPNNTTTGGSYDPYMVKVGSTWYVVYTVVDPKTFVGENFYTALATTTDFSSFTGIGADTSQKINEGPRLIPTNSDLWVVTGGRGEQIVYDETLTQQGTALDVDVALYNGTDTQPWPVMFSWDDEVVMLTWDNTKGITGQNFTWGSIWVYTAPRSDGVTGDLDVTAADAVLAATGSQPLVGTLTVTAADASLEAAGEVFVYGDLDAATADAALIASGVSGAGVIGSLGELSLFTDDAVLVATGAVDVLGDLDVVAEDAGLAAFAFVGSNGPFERRRVMLLN